MTPLPPWHDAHWRRINDHLKTGRVPHALLLSGAPGLGKQRFALALSNALLCQNRRDDGTACGHCRDCTLYAAGTHPDYRPTTPDEEDKPITIDAIRDLHHYLALKSHRGGYKVAVIAPADRMNTAAANCLLKNLEEPPPQTVIILIAARPMVLPATVRSRCRRLAFYPPPRAQARAWLLEQEPSIEQPDLVLGLAQGGPLTALHIARSGQDSRRRAVFADLAGLIDGRRDPIQIAQAWLKLDIKLSLYWVYTWLVDVIRLQSVSRPPACINSDFQPQLVELAQKMDKKFLHNRLDQVQQALRLLETQVNKQLLLEDALLSWVRPPEGTYR